MNIDKQKLKAMAQAVIDLEDPWYTVPQLTIRAVDEAPAALMAALTPEVVLALLAEIESLQEHKQHLVDLRETNGFDSWSTALVEIDRLKAENEALKSHRTDWQAKCLKRGFQYVRESDDHYVLADLPEMAELLGELLGVEVRGKDGDSYGEALSVVQEQLDAANNAFLQAYEAKKECDALRKDAERYRWLKVERRPAADLDAAFNTYGVPVDEAIDAAMAREASECQKSSS